MLPWETQVIQYPPKGERGISYFAGPTSFGDVDCLLWRDDWGHVRGILNHYGMDCPPWEHKGNVNIFVDPQWRRRGIATALLTEAVRRWPIDFDHQRYSRAGYETVQHFRKAVTA
jgi:GNAT superfamily N-acetyltransferase